MERFIETVRQHPVLWDVSSKEYRNPEIKEAAWQSVVDNLDSKEIKDVKEAKSEWKKLRDNHRDSIKRMRTSKTAQLTNINTWKYAHLMEFLLPYMKTGRRSINLSSQLTSTFETFEGQEDEDADNSEMSVLSNNDTMNNTDGGLLQERILPRKRSAQGDYPELYNEMNQNHQKMQLDRYLKCTMTSSGQDKSAIDLFLESMAMTINTMPMWMQNRIKKKIFLIVSDAEEELENFSGLRSDPSPIHNYDH